MKNSIFVLITVISIAVFLHSCHQGESITAQIQEVNGALKVHVVDEGSGSVISGSSLDVYPSESVQVKGRSPNMQFAKGKFTAYSGNFYDFKVFLNPSGIHGEITIESLERGTVTAEALCVSTADGEATAGILLTSVEDPTEFFAAGDIVYLKLKDNGEGANAEADQTSANIIIFFNWELFPYATPEEFVSDFSCENIEFIYALASGNPEPFGAFQNIQDGNVQVK